jgi:agmatine deiminase
MGNSIDKSKPKTSGRMMLKQFRMPAEWHPHRRCWMLWPYRTDNWKCNAAPAQAAFLQVANAISSFEPVTMGVRKDQMEKAQKLFSEFKSTTSLKHPIDLVEMESNDAWMRDVGPTFLVPRDPATHKKLLGVDWIFNAWGQKYDDWRNDDAIASQVTDYAQSDRIRADFILEGGSIHVDGEGTILTTEECLLHPNRNHSLTKEQIEERLLNYLEARK